MSIIIAAAILAGTFTGPIDGPATVQPAPVEEQAPAGDSLVTAERGSRTIEDTPSELRVIIPSIGIDRRVVFGDQSDIDNGEVVALREWACLPSQPCTVWLMAHRSTHGSLFQDVPTLAPGSIVYIVYGTDVAVYKTNPPRIVTSYGWRDALGPDLTLQTSWFFRTRILVSAERLDL